MLIRIVLKSHPLLKIVSRRAVYLPCPANISYFWNFGSLLGVALGTQILTGIFLAIFYVRDTRLAFERVDHLIRDVNYGWLIRTIHANGARIFFCFLYLHMGRGVYYGSYHMISETWLSGVTLLLLVIATAFLGYVLPWGQMSFWGATVITNLFSAIPFIGNDIVTWLWGGYSVDCPTLTRFFSLHFLIPFVISGAIAVHLLLLHQSGRGNPLGVNRNLNKIMFHPYFSSKDLFGARVAFLVFLIVVLYYSWDFGDPENFIPANPLVTPVHIQPEWYFLFAYAILRSIPRKLGGVVALAISVVIYYFLPVFPYLASKKLFISNRFSVVSKIMFWRFVACVFLLTWIGACPVEAPYIILGQILTVSYFSYFVILFLIHKYNVRLKY